jgi:hypothetical protein
MNDCRDTEAQFYVFKISFKSTNSPCGQIYHHPPEENLTVANGMHWVCLLRGKGKNFPCVSLIKHYAMKAYGGVDKPMFS